MTTNQPVAERSFWGRVFVLGPFWGVSAYVALAIIGSLVTTLYGGAPTFAQSDAAARARQREWCLRTLVTLHDELESEVTHALTRIPEPPLERFTTFEERWQGELELAAARCGTELEPAIADAYAKLRSLHQGYAAGVTQLMRTRHDVGGALTDRLKGLTSGPRLPVTAKPPP